MKILNSFAIEKNRFPRKETVITFLFQKYLERNDAKRKKKKNCINSKERSTLVSSVFFPEIFIVNQFVRSQGKLSCNS